MRKSNYITSIFFAVFVYLVLFVVFLFNFFGADDYSMQCGGLAGQVVNGIDFTVRYGNGRLLGNFFLYYFNYVPIVRMIIKPLALLILILCVNYVFNIKRLWAKIAVAMLIIIPSSGFYASCYSINACFGNYVLPITTVFLCFAFMKIYATGRRKAAGLILPLLFVTSVCMQLYCENATIIFLLSAICFVAYDLYSTKKASAEKIIFLIGGILGAAIMVILPKMVDNPIIDQDTMESYRHIVINIPFSIGILAKFAEYFSTAALWIVLFGLLMIYIVKKESPDDKFKLWHILLSVIYPAVCVIYLFFQTTETKVISGTKLIFLALTVLFFINAFIIFIRFVRPQKEKIFSVFMLAILAMSAGMFIFVNQSGYRTFYLSLFIFISLTLYIADYVVKEYNLKLDSTKTKQLNYSAIAVLLCLSVLLPLQTIQNYDAFAMRQEYVDTKLAEGEKTLYVPKVPNTNLVRDEWIDFYREYYTRHSDGVKVIFVDMEEWERYWDYRSMLDNPITSITYAIEHLDYGNANVY